MRLLFIIKSLERGGGAERVLTTIANELNKNHDVTILVFKSTKEEYETSARLIKKDEKKLKVGNSVFRLFTRMKTIKEIVNAGSFDVIISFMKESDFPVLLCKKFNLIDLPVISALQNNIQRDYTLVERTLARMLYSEANLVIRCSANLTLHKGSTTNIRTILNPVAPEFVRARSIKLHSKFANKHSKKIITIGRLVPQKNHKLMIDVFAKLVQQFPELTLTIVGDGPLKKTLEQQVKMRGVENNIIFAGRIKNVGEELKKADIFLFTSIYEGFSLALLEAAAYNLPIVSSDCKYGPSELLNDAEPEKTKNFLFAKRGILVESSNLNAYLEALYSLITDSKLRKRYALADRQIIDLVRPETVAKEWHKAISFVKKRSSPLLVRK